METEAVPVERVRLETEERTDEATVRGDVRKKRIETDVSDETGVADETGQSDR
ncbi:hypothetical protein [Streptomyces coeruleorubidus]|uniref:hypothetical protein n=1 Tax=Streptomyces coeruleorubidus TaxID=116188 RepID=UPI0033D943C0